MFASFSSSSPQCHSKKNLPNSPSPHTPSAKLSLKHLPQEYLSFPKTLKLACALKSSKLGNARTQLKRRQEHLEALDVFDDCNERKAKIYRIGHLERVLEL
jgi:hypothetical protein